MMLRIPNLFDFQTKAAAYLNSIFQGKLRKFSEILLRYFKPAARWRRWRQTRLNFLLYPAIRILISSESAETRTCNKPVRSVYRYNTPVNLSQPV